MIRYLTQRYVAVTRDQAERLALIDGSARIVETHGVELVHATNLNAASCWAFWSDGAITTSIGLPAELKERRGLSAAAAELIDSVRGSDSGSPRVAGGYATLAAVQDVARDEVFVGESRGVYARQRVERLTARLSDGSQRTMLLTSGGYSEGYAYELEDLYWVPSPNEVARNVAAAEVTS